MTDKYQRQLDLVNYDDLNFPIIILGVGGIGSWTAFLLSKMGCQNISIIDDDLVEEHNTASQFYKLDQLGMEKTKALVQNIEEQSGENIYPYPISMQEEVLEKLSKEPKALVVIAVDSMDARRKINDQISRIIGNGKDLYVIDARMGGLQLELYNCKASEYHTTLVKNEEVQREACTGRSICFNCSTIGSFIANYVRLYSKNELEDNAKGIILLFHKGISLLRN